MRKVISNILNNFTSMLFVFVAMLATITGGLKIHAGVTFENELLGVLWFILAMLCLCLCFSELKDGARR